MHAYGDPAATNNMICFESITPNKKGCADESSILGRCQFLHCILSRHIHTPICDGFVDLLPGGLVLPLQLVLQLLHLLHVLSAEREEVCRGGESQGETLTQSRIEIMERIIANLRVAEFVP